MKRIAAVNDFVIKFANVNGSGSASANELFAKAVMRMGVPVSPRNIFPSNIQGMPTWYEARVCEKGYHGRRGGVDMMVAGGQGSEYGWQRPSCEFFLGYAMGHGIKVTLPAESDLLKTAFPYGDHIGNEWRKKLQEYRTEMSRRRGIMTQQRDEAMYAIAELTGAINAADHWLLAWMPGDPGAPEAGRVPLPNSHKGVPDMPAASPNLDGV